MEVLHVGHVVTINPETFFPCTKNNMRRLLFMAGEDREKVREEVRSCLEELKQLHPDIDHLYDANITMLEAIE